MPEHDPEALAAAYLAGGELDARARSEYEDHLLHCDDCWAEVQLARRGRQLLESIHDPAPAALRDRIRAVTELTERGERRRRGPAQRRWRAGRAWTAAAAMLVLITTVGTLIVTDGTDDARTGRAATSVTAAVRDLREGVGSDPGVEPPARVLGAFHWQGSGTADLDGLPVTEHVYREPGGARLLVVRGTREFARPGAASRLPSGEWSIRRGGASVLCISRPAPYLIVAEDMDRARQVAGQLART